MMSSLCLELVRLVVESSPTTLARRVVAYRHLTGTFLRSFSGFQI